MKKPAFLTMIGFCAAIYLLPSLFASDDLSEIFTGKQLVRAQNVSYTGDSRRMGNNPEDFDLGATLKAGNWVILSFFNNTCVNCMKEMPWLDDLQGKYKNRKLVVAFVDVSASSENRARESSAFLAKIKVTNTYTYFDYLGVLAGNWKVRTPAGIEVPATFVVGPDFFIREAHRGWVTAKEEAKFKADFEKRLEGWLAE